MVRVERALRGNQIGLALRDLRLVLLHAQNGERADLHALLVLIQLRLGQLQRLLLHLHIFLGVNEFVIGVRDGGHAGDDLLAQALFGLFQLVFGDADVQPRVVNPEIFQQRLRELRLDLAAGTVRMDTVIRRASHSLRNVAAEIVMSMPHGSEPPTCRI